MGIKEGYNGQKLEIRINGREDESAELWINMHGLPETSKQETLSYVTINELLALKKEVEQAIRSTVGLK